MKNIKCYKSMVALFMAGTISLVSGCGSTKTDESKNEGATQTTKVETCKHFITDFGDQSIIFKECEGYDIKISTGYKSSEIYYEIYDEDENLIFDGFTQSYNCYTTTHDYAEEVENVNTKVFKLK